MNWGNSTSGSLRVGNEVLQVGLRMWMEELAGHRSRQGVGWGRGLSNAHSTGPIQREEAGLTSDQRQPFPPALPATASPLTAPGTPQPSGLGTRTKGLQRAEGCTVSEGAGRGEYEPSQGRILQTSLVKTKFSISNPLPRGLGDKCTELGTGEQIRRLRRGVWTKPFLSEIQVCSLRQQAPGLRLPQMWHGDLRRPGETWALPLLNQASVYPLSIQFMPSRPQEARISS